jgi:hypothetical protein
MYFPGSFVSTLSNCGPGPELRLQSKVRLG